MPLDKIDIAVALILVLIPVSFYAYGSGMVFSFSQSDSQEFTYTDFNNPELSGGNLSTEKFEMRGRTINRTVGSPDTVDGWNLDGRYVSKSYVINEEGEKEFVDGIVLLGGSKSISREIGGLKDTLTVNTANLLFTIPDFDSGCSNVSLILVQGGEIADNITVSNQHSYQNYTFEFREEVEGKRENVKLFNQVRADSCGMPSIVGIDEIYISYR